MTWLVICGRCFYAGTQSAFDVKLVTDDGTRIGANRRVLSEANSVFGAMLEGNFFESTADEVEFSCANSKSVVLLIHHLYGCRGCKVTKTYLQVSTNFNFWPVDPKNDLFFLCSNYFHVASVFIHGSTSNLFHTFSWRAGRDPQGRLVFVWNLSLEQFRFKFPTNFEWLIWVGKVFQPCHEIGFLKIT